MVRATALFKTPMTFLRTDARLPWAGKLILTLLPVLILCFAYVKRSSELAETDRAKLMPTAGKLVDAAKKVALPIPAPERESERRKELRLERQFMLYKDTVASFKRMGWAMLVILIAVPIGVMMGSYPWAESLGKTIMVILSMIPALALLSILFLTLGTGEVAKVGLIVLGVFPMICLDTYLRAKALPRQHRGQDPPRQGRIGHRTPGKSCEPFFEVKGQNELPIGEFEHLGRQRLAGGFFGQHEEQFAIGKPFVEPQTGGVVMRRGVHRRIGDIKRRLSGCRHYCKTSAMRARSAGSRSVSDHGFFLSHPVLRHDG